MSKISCNSSRTICISEICQGLCWVTSDNKSCKDECVGYTLFAAKVFIFLKSMSKYRVSHSHSSFDIFQWRHNSTLLTKHDNFTEQRGAVQTFRVLLGKSPAWFKFRSILWQFNLLSCHFILCFLMLKTFYCVKIKETQTAQCTGKYV